MQRFAVVLTGILASTVVVLSACSAGGDSPQPTPVAGAQQVTLTVGNGMSFNPSTLTVQAGQPVQLTLQNTGAMPHDFTLTDGVSQSVKITAGGGQASSGVFTIQSPGTYSFDCSMPGHASAGMKGTISAE
jgi:nitrite reductase (NO-forming)